MSTNHLSEKNKTAAQKIANKEPHTGEEPAGEIKRVFVVLNPVAGLSDANQVRGTIEQYCQQMGWDCDIHETKKDEDLRQLIGGVVKNGTDLVIVSGGDGTVSAVVGGMVNSKIPMGILPAGTGNALARDLNIPLGLDEALQLLGGDHRVLTVDAMQIKDDYFVLNVSVGVSARTMRDTPREQKRRFGMLAYLLHGFRSVVKARLHRFNAVVDNRRVRFSASEIMIANEKLLGLQPKIDGVEINPNDGRLDLFIVRAQSLRDYLDVVISFILNRKREYETNLRYLKVENQVVIDSIVPQPVQADGELIGNTPVEIKMVKDALKIIIPPDNKAGEGKPNK